MVVHTCDLSAPEENTGQLGAQGKAEQLRETCKVSQQHNKKSPGWASVLLVLRAWYWGWEEEKLSTAVSRPVCLQLDPQSPGDHAEM